MGLRLRQSWPIVKLVLAAVIVVLVGRRFWLDLREHPELLDRSFRHVWLFACGLLYVLGLAFPTVYWWRLMRAVGERPPFWQAVRAYYIGQMGKYVPGKAYALVLRADLVRGPGTRAGLAGLTAFYEVFVTMACGALMAALLFATLLPPATKPLDLARLVALLTREATTLDRTLAVAFSLGLSAPLLIVLLPPVFNRLAHRLSRPFRTSDEPLPRLGFRHLGEGLLLTTGSWFCLGGSLAAALAAILPETSEWDAATLGRLTAVIAVVYVAGFLILVSPGALGVREYLLTLFLVADRTILASMVGDDAAVYAGLGVVVLRLVWTLAEVVMVAVVWYLPREKPS